MNKKRLTSLIAIVLVILLTIFGEFLNPSDADPQTTTVPTMATVIETQPDTSEPPATSQDVTQPEQTTAPEAVLDEDGSYTSKEDVALYIHIYGRLPKNFLTKSQARDLGWRSGSLERYAPGMSIGGDRFQNRENLLPKAPGRYYTECDIGTRGSSSRGARRIVFSNDGLIYYTHDHYETFELLYGEE